MRSLSSDPHLSGPALAALVHAAESAALGDLVYVAFARTMGISKMLTLPANQCDFASLDTTASPPSREKP